MQLYDGMLALLTWEEVKRDTGLYGLFELFT